MQEKGRHGTCSEVMMNAARTSSVGAIFDRKKSKERCIESYHEKRQSCPNVYLVATRTGEEGAGQGEYATSFKSLFKSFN